jgi:hypothetical protein
VLSDPFQLIECEHIHHGYMSQYQVIGEVSRTEDGAIRLYRLSDYLCTFRLTEFWLGFARRFFNDISAYHAELIELTAKPQYKGRNRNQVDNGITA